MISKWKVFNFKSIRTETELDFARLTIFAGANSSGKSTFIQSILLVAQTLANKVSSRSVVLNGAFTSLGQFDDIRSNNSQADQISIQCTCRPILESDSTEGSRHPLGGRSAYYLGPQISSFREINCEISFDADPSNPEREFFQIQPRLYATQLSCLSRDEDNLDQVTQIAIRRSLEGVGKIDSSSIEQGYGDELVSSLSYDVELDDSALVEMREEFRSAKPLGCELLHFLPSRIVYAINTIEEDANALTLALQGDRRNLPGYHRSLRRNIHVSGNVLDVLKEVLGGVIDPTELFRARQRTLFDIDDERLTVRTWYDNLRTLPPEEQRMVIRRLNECEDLFERIHQALRSSRDGGKGETAFIHARQPRQVFEAIRYLDNFFSGSVKYLGPLRDAPRPLYPLAPAADPQDVGLRGEHTASILELHKSKKVDYIPSSCFESAEIKPKAVTRTLGSAVVDWLQYLGVASDVESKDMGKLGHELKVALSNSDGVHDLTHVGVGVSQVLPILVMCLLADEDSTLVFEQPELHLHPKVQTLLGDFFASMTLCNKQCIVETHSEYLIDRLRFRIAASGSNVALSDKVKIYFVEKPDSTTTFREVVVNEYGAITDWPEGFFDQSQQQAEDIVRAATLKRKRKAREKDG